MILIYGGNVTNEEEADMTSKTTAILQSTKVYTYRCSCLCAHVSQFIYICEFFKTFVYV